MESVFWDKGGVIHVDFLARGATINTEFYCRVLSDAHKRLRKKRPGLINEGVLFLQDNAELILLTALRVHYSNSAGRYCHIPLTARTSFRVISTCLDL